jgi:hypothetical protein
MSIKMEIALDASLLARSTSIDIRLVEPGRPEAMRPEISGG